MPERGNSEVGVDNFFMLYATVAVRAGSEDDYALAVHSYN